MELGDDVFNAYAAGLFDGEGSLVKRGYAGSFWLEISNSHKPTLDLIQRRVGYGRVEVQIRKGSPVRSQPVYYHKVDVWRWRVSRFEDITNFVNRVLPYVSVKKTAVDGVLEFLRTHPGRKPYRRYPPNTREKALELLGQGHSTRETGRVLGVYHSTVWKWGERERARNGANLFRLQK